jgi:hypothetical protein
MCEEEDSMRCLGTYGARVACLVAPPPVTVTLLQSVTVARPSS